MPIRVVLVRPEQAANIGAVARVIRNTGLSGLDIVAPSPWRTVECWRTAWGATDVLERAREFSDLRSALADSNWSVGFSRRMAGALVGDVRESAMTIAALPRDENVSLVFGPETSGLSDEDLALVGRRAAIPSHPDQPSFNLSHAVLIAAYEVFRAGVRKPDGGRRASHAEKEAFLDLLGLGLDALRGVSPGRREGYLRVWRTFLHRSDLSPKELRALNHLARRMAALRQGRDVRPGEAVGATSPDGVQEVSPSDSAGPAGEPGAGEAERPYFDVVPTAEGFSIPELKWRELLFVGALRADGDEFVRDPGRPLPAFASAGLFAAGVRYAVSRGEGRVEVKPVRS
jgi:tRNA/rRNA methyltransferase